MLKEGDTGTLTELFEKNGNKGGFYVFRASSACSPSIKYLIMRKAKRKDGLIVNVYNSERLLHKKRRMVSEMNDFTVIKIFKDWNQNYDDWKQGGL